MMSMLSDSCRFPHTITDEDGRKWENHPGYTEKNCVVCHKDFIVGKQIAPSVTNCGGKGCDNLAPMGA